MTDRREFLKLATAAMAISVTGGAQVQEVSTPDRVEIHNQQFRARFSTTTGRIDIWRAGNTLFLTNALFRAVGPSWSFASSKERVQRTAHTERFEDVLGQGARIVAEVRDSTRGIKLQLQLCLYDQREAVVLEVSCHNLSSAPIMLQSVEPVRALEQEGSICAWDDAVKVITNGFMYYDPGSVMPLTAGHAVESMWNMGFSGAGDNRPGLAVGYLDNDTAIGRISATAAEGLTGGTHGLGLIAESSYTPEFLIKPGGVARSGRFVLLTDRNPFLSLEAYAQMVGEQHKVRLNPIINGWSNWFYTHYQHVTEDEILKNAEFAAKYLKPYGLEWIQLDDGYQRTLGDWEGNERFPHGMKWLAERIRQVGLRPGIWVAPYAIAEGTSVHREHPEWLIRDRDGSIRRCGERDGTVLYGLDISVPGAADCLRRLFQKYVNDWGYDFIKIDFVEWTILAAERYHDPTWSRATAYRKGAQIMREVMGPDRHLLDCGPGQITVGLIDSMRIELDLPYLTWDQYAVNYNSTAPAMAKRYYFHKRMWINDADQLGLALLNPAQACAAASIVALSGGTMISCDRLFELDQTKLEILQKVFPSYGEAARPVDLFEHEKPEIFALQVSKPFEKWSVVGLFNFDERSASEKAVSFDRLSLDAEKTWLGYEFWSQRFLGTFRKEVQVLVPPQSVAVLALREARGVPQILSTDRHFTQGGIEFENVAWNDKSATLSGVSLGSDGTHHRVVIYIPIGYSWDVSDSYFPHDFDGYSAQVLPNGLMRLHVNFEHAGRVAWSLLFRRA